MCYFWVKGSPCLNRIRSSPSKTSVVRALIFGPHPEAEPGALPDWARTRHALNKA